MNNLLAYFDEEKQVMIYLLTTFYNIQAIL